MVGFYGNNYGYSDSYREGILLNAFFSERGLVVIGQDEQPSNPIRDAISQLDFKALVFNEELGYELELIDGKYDYLTSVIPDFKRIIYNDKVVGVAITVPEDEYECNFLTSFKIKPFYALEDFDHIIACFFCDKQSNLFNFEKEKLSDEEVLITEKELFQIADRVLKYLHKDVYYYKIYDFDNLNEFKCIDSEYDIFYEDFSFFGYSRFGRLYMNDKKDIFKYKVNNLWSIKEKLEIIDDYFSFIDAVDLFEGLEDLDEIVDIDGEVFSKQNFASEFIQEVSKRKQKGVFLKKLFELITNENDLNHF